MGRLIQIRTKFESIRSNGDILSLQTNYKHQNIKNFQQKRDNVIFEKEIHNKCQRNILRLKIQYNKCRLRIPAKFENDKLWYSLQLFDEIGEDKHRIRFIKNIRCLSTNIKETPGIPKETKSDTNYKQRIYSKNQSTIKHLKEKMREPSTELIGGIKNYHLKKDKQSLVSEETFRTLVKTHKEKMVGEKMGFFAVPLFPPLPQAQVYYGQARKATGEMIHNRGLTRYRKISIKNPRVKNRG